MENNDLIDQIVNIKKTLGKELVILAHHYQRQDIVKLGDHIGDSFALAQKAAANKEARYIVFCGVHFMAESAEILSMPHQTVQIPSMDAGCWMADMAEHHHVLRSWDEIESITGAGNVMPIVYMNSDAELKAFCGKNGGLVCTSSNAPAAFEWAFKQRDKIFFFPDQHLGRNSGNSMGIPSDQMIVWDPKKPFGGNSPEKIRNSKIILWDGYCLVHTRFHVEHIENMKKKYPDAAVVVHPECTEDVVALSDAVGSTKFIVDYIRKAPSGSTVLVGTEVNLVGRMAHENPDKQILDLHYSLCPNMFKINPENLLFTLENIGNFNVVTVPEEIKHDARLALDRMLDL